MSSADHSYDVTDELSSDSVRVPRTHFLDLPTEILVFIAIFLTPVDIVNLTKCCRHLSSVASQRPVWRSALIDACHEHQVFAPTFPISQMTTDEIKEACTRPFRLRSRIWAHGANSFRYPFSPVKRDSSESVSDATDGVKYPALRPTHRYGSLLSALSSSESSSGPNIVIQHVHLISGGRFLLATDDQNKLYLWDLGYKSEMSTSSSLHPLAERKFEAPNTFYTENQLKHVQPTRDGQGLVFSVTLSDPSREDEWRGLEEYIVEIYPTTPTPHFELVANRLYCEYEECLALTPDVVIHHNEDCHDYPVIWYFRVGVSRHVKTGRFVLSVLIHEQTALAMIPYQDPVGICFRQFSIPSDPSKSTPITANEYYTSRYRVRVIKSYDYGESPSTSADLHLRFIQACAWFNAPKEVFVEQLDALLDFATKASDRLRSDSDTGFLPHTVYPPTFARHNALQNQSEVGLNLLEEYMWLQKDRISENVHLCAIRRQARDGVDGADIVGVALDWKNAEDHDGTNVTLNGEWPVLAQLMCAFSGRLVLPTKEGDVEIVDFV